MMRSPCSSRYQLAWFCLSTRGSVGPYKTEKEMLPEPLFSLSQNRPFRETTTCSSWIGFVEVIPQLFLQTIHQRRQAQMAPSPRCYSMDRGYKPSSSREKFLTTARMFSILCACGAPLGKEGVVSCLALAICTGGSTHDSQTN